MKNLGAFYALSAYFMWGFAPLLWKAMDQVGSAEIVAHRMIWACLFALLLVLLSRQFGALISIIRQPALMARLLAASLLVSLNWAIYIWGVNSGHIVETAMGYFINPLINVVFGFLFFQERPKPVQWIAISLATFGVAYIVFEHGRLPWIALSLALSFASYGAIKKSLSISALHSMTIETAFVFIPALAFVVYLAVQQQGSFAVSTDLSILLVIGGIFTLGVLLLFSAAAKKISLTALGMFQYLGPTIQLLVGVLIFHEPFGTQQLIPFSLIWLALLIFSMDQLYASNRRRLTT